MNVHTVDWPTFAGIVVDEAPDEAIVEAARASGPFAHVWVAAAVQRMPAGAVDEILARVGPPEYSAGIGVWLRTVTAAFRRAVLLDDAAVVVDAVAHAGDTPARGLQVLDGLRDDVPAELWALARDVARLQPHGQLIVRRAPLVDLNGVYRSADATICLAPHLAGQDLVVVFVHELGHALDQHRTGTDLDEVFAARIEGAAYRRPLPSSICDLADEIRQGDALRAAHSPLPPPVTVGWDLATFSSLDFGPVEALMCRRPPGLRRDADPARADRTSRVSPRAAASARQGPAAAGAFFPGASA